ncbi:MAG TPA: extracellular solute-binding protein [Firmicutes bacterium]|nr:extracellular solute-binding protein [Bacillota bacterium]
MKLKKTLALIMAGLLVAGLTACSGGGGESSSGEGGNSGTSDGGGASHSADSLWNRTFEGVTLKRLLWYEPSESENALKEEFEERTGCTIEDTVVDYQNYNTVLANSISSDDPYDIGYLYGAFFPTQVIAGMYQPVNDYMTDEYLLDNSSAETIANGGFDMQKMNYYHWGGNYYGLSSYWDVDMLVLLYRTDLIVEAGLQTPNDYVEQGNWNLDTFYELASSLTNPSRNMYGYSAGGENTRSYAEFIGSYGTQVVKYDSNGVPSQNLDDPLVLDALNFIQKMTYGSGAVVSPGSAEVSFRRGNAAMTIDGLYEIPKMLNDTNVSDVVKNNWDIAPIPLAAGNADGAYPTDWLKAIGIVNGSENPDAVVAFALAMSKGIGDNAWQDSLSEEQFDRVTPFYANINYSNYAYGTLGEDLVTMIARIMTGDDVSQLIDENKLAFQAQIDRVING